MRVVDVGVHPVGFIAIGANATGFVAVGQLATGIIAVGQLARGGVVIGQLSLGLVTIGQLSLGVGWSAGMVGVGGTSGPGLIFGAVGRLRLTRLGGRKGGHALDGTPTNLFGWVVATVTVVLLAVLWWIAAGHALVHELTRAGGILRSPPHVLR